MTIERYELNPGVEFNFSQDPVAQTEAATRATHALKSVLSAREHDVTPEVWTRYGSNRSRYNLIVHDDGTATLRLIPVDSDSETIVASGEGANVKPGGRVFNIPQDAVTFPIIGPQRGDPTFRIYEVIKYTPGPNPRSNS